jgi:hypothetical protein
MADLVQTAANVLKSSGNVANVVAGETITQGMVLYKKSSDGEWYKADVDGTGSPTAETAGSGGLGIALNAAANGQPIMIQQDGEIDPGATATEGVVYVASPAVDGSIAVYGDLSAADNDYVTIVGVGNSSGNIDLNLFASGAIL